MHIKFNRVLCLVCALLLALPAAACTAKGDSETQANAEKKQLSANFSGYDRVESGTVVLENDRFLFSLNSENTHFTLTDKKHNATYYSVPDASTLDEEKRGETESEIVAEYYNSQSVLSYLYSGKNSVPFGAFEVYKKQGAVRVIYTLRLTRQSVLAPIVLSEERYNQLSSAMDAQSRRRMGLYYTKFLSQNNDSRTKLMKERFKALQRENLYILKDNPQAIDLENITQYVTSAGYTIAQYQEDLKELSIPEEMIELPLEFKIPVEYRLLDDGFDVSILSDQIESANDSYKLQKISLLPNFRQAGDEEGILLIPDGSGAVIDLSIHDDAIHTFPFYGADKAKETEDSAQLVQNLTLPVFGISNTHGAYLAVIESSAEEAQLTVKRKGSINFVSGAYSSFNIVPMDETKIRRQKTLLSFADHAMSEIATVRYIFLEKQADIGKMAEALRSYLGLEKQKHSFPLYLEFRGYVTADSSFLGVPVKKKTVLSTIRGITETVEKLHAQGVKPIVVRFRDFSDGGDRHSLQNRFSLYKGVGTLGELKALAELLAKEGGGLYLEFDVSTVYSDGLFDDFNAMSDSVKKVDRTLARQKRLNIVTSKLETSDAAYLVSPSRYLAYTQSYLESFKKRVGESSIQFSASFAGKNLVSDLNRQKVYDRMMSKNEVLKSLSLLKERGSVMTDVGNAYVLPVTDHVLNVALTSSQYSIEQYSVPFYQMVVGGSVSFAGNPVNLSFDSRAEILYSAASGAALQYSVITESDALWKLAGTQELFPSPAEKYMDEIVSNYKFLCAIHELVQDSPIIGYYRVSDQLYITKYKNGVMVAANFGDTDVIYSDVSVGAQSWAVIKEEIQHEN